MKTKRLKNMNTMNTMNTMGTLLTSLPRLLVAVLTATALTGCGEDIYVDDTPQGGGTGTQSAHRTVFSSGPAANHSPVNGRNRTSMDASRNFYWSEGDQIYVNTNGSSYKKTSKSTLLNRGVRAEFELDDVSLTAEKCSVVYIGNGTAAKTVDKSDLRVKIEARQTQSAWGNSDHLGASGDCGTAVARKDQATGEYTFDLDHKASYLVLQPYRPTGNAKPDWKLVKIEIIANGMPLAGTYGFGTGELVGTGTSNTIEFNCGTDGFDLKHTAASAARSCFAVIAPGQRELTIRYTVKVAKKPNVLYFENNGSIDEDGVFTVDKPIAARQYAANVVTTIKHVLSPNPFYCWDAPADQPYDYSLWGDNHSTLYEPASRSCKDMPNANELYWYIVSGDPRWDNTTPWSNDGGLTERTGGIWIMTRAAILAAGRTFDPNVGKGNVDMRATFQGHSVNTTTYKTGGRPADTSNYFFLPAQGFYFSGSLDNPGTGGYYWSSSPYPGLSATAYRLYFSSGLVSLYRNHRYNGFVAGSQWFK